MSSYKRIGVITTSQHLHTLDSVCALLKGMGKAPVPCGQILGCNVENAKEVAEDVDAFLYIGSGMFHPGAYLREIEKPLFVANPYSCEVSCHLSEEYARWRGRQKARVLRCLDAHLFGVLVSTKTGQFDMEKHML